MVLAGDFNVVPTDKDIYPTKSWDEDALLQPESRALFRSLLHLGLTDAFREFNKLPHQYSYWDYQAGAWQRDAGFRIDHLMLSPAAADRLTGAGVDKDTRALEKASDHAPTWITLK